MKVKLAIAGFGHLGKWHVEKALTNESVDLVAIAENDSSKHETLRNQFPGQKIVSDIAEVIHEIDAGVIVTPTTSHFSLIRSLMEHKKHIFCEKPLTYTLGEANELREILKDYSPLLQVGHIERFHQCWEKESIIQDYLKNKSTVTFKRLALYKPRVMDVDVVKDMMVHDLDLMVYLFKENPTHVTCFGHQNVSSNWDYVQAIFDFASGKKAITIAGRGFYEEKREVEFVNESGHLKVDLQKFNLTYTVKEDSTSTPSDVKIVTKDYEKRDHLSLEQATFITSILENQKAIVDYHDGWRSMFLVEKVHESLTKNQKIALSFT